MNLVDDNKGKTEKDVYRSKYPGNDKLDRKNQKRKLFYNLTYTLLKKGLVFAS